MYNRSYTIHQTYLDWRISMGKKKSEKKENKKDKKEKKDKKKKSKK
jgi:hypothetical protein